jgi:hypothetical protein
MLFTKAFIASIAACSSTEHTFLQLLHDKTLLEEGDFSDTVQGKLGVFS